ncbi:MAG: PRC-barrel domain-containing protein [Candidatus Heimdallarchaeota archaeon]
MKLCKMDDCITISDLRKKAVISSDGLKIGKIVDVVFTTDCKLHSFIIGGSRWEEIREKLGLIEDIDPVIPVESVKTVKDVILLDIPKEKLLNYTDEGVIPENAFTYSTMKRKNIFDGREQRFGKIVNLVFAPTGEAAFIIGGSIFEEVMESLGIKENVDLFLPITNVHEVIDKRIKLNKPIDELKLSANDKLMDEGAHRKFLNTLKSEVSLQTHVRKRKYIEGNRDMTRIF